MTIEIIKNQITKFITSSTPEVMAIKGEWGVGKTFTWKKFLSEVNANDAVAYGRYSYVSLFGINSLDSLKFAIFENTVPRKIIDAEPNMETFKENAVGFGESLGRKSWNILKEAPIAKWFNPAIQSLSFLSLQKTLICIDDLERKGDKLSVKDILGLISHLKEQKKCKVVILLNDGEDGLADYNKYKEKVIDIELRFSPTPKECAEIAFVNEKPYSSHLRSLSEKLQIRNIRILKKIENLVYAIDPLFEKLEAEISLQVRHSLTLYAWCYYCSPVSDNDIPTLDFVTNIGFSFYGIGDGRDDDGASKKWKSLLIKYEYNATDELDLVLADYVKTGYFIDSEMLKKANAKNHEILVAKSEGSFNEAWQLYHNSFDDNAEMVINGLYESFKVNVKNISPTDLNGTVRLFRDLGEDGKATEIIDIYVAQRSDTPNIFNLREIQLFGDVTDPEVVNKFNSAYQKSVSIESAKQVLDRIAGKNSWNTSDEVILVNTPVEEFYILFKSERGKHLTSIINACLTIGAASNATPQQTEIVNRAKEALLRIASESEINRRRVKKYGVDV